MTDKESVADKTNRESREERQTQALEKIAAGIEGIGRQLVSLNHSIGAASRSSSFTSR